jgi:hypothetical protein
LEIRELEDSCPKEPRSAACRPSSGSRKAVLPSVPRQAVEDAAEALAKQSVAENTTRSYKSDWESWEAFCGAHGFSPLPADPEQVRMYLTQLTQFAGRKGRMLKPRTAQRHLAAIAAAHRAEDIGFDTRHPVLCRTIAGIRRAFGGRQEGAPALRYDASPPSARRSDWMCVPVRNKAIILLGFAGGFRRSELVALNVEDLDFEKHKDGLAVVLKRSKTDQDGKGRTVAIAAERWIAEGRHTVMMTRFNYNPIRPIEVRLWVSLLSYKVRTVWPQWLPCTSVTVREVICEGSEPGNKPHQGSS